MTDERTPGERNAIVLLVLSGLLAIYVGLFWLAGQVSGLLLGRGWPASSIGDVGGIVIGVLHHGSDPAQAWPAAAAASVGPAWLVYGLFVAFVAPTMYLGIHLTRLSRDARLRPESRRARLGFASPDEVRTLLAASAVVKKAKVVRPSTAGQKNVDPRTVGFFLGRDIRSRHELFASVEDVFIVLAPPRQGKDVHFCAPFTIDAPGPCIVTSTRADAFTNTLAMRRQYGKIHVFDPNGLTNWPERMRWSPVRGCEAPITAGNRAAAFILGSGFRIEGEAAYWVAVAISILRCYLHAAALSDRTIADVVRWSTQPSNPEPFTILRHAEAEGRAAPGWAGELEAAANADPRFRAGMWATLVQSLSCFSDPAVLHACSPSDEEMFELPEFLAGRNTLYVLGKEKKNSSVAPVITAMMEDIFDETRRIASRMPGSRLDPPLTVELNEVAHIAPMPSLPGYMGDSGGFSIALHVYLQSLSQARSKWGEHEAMIMWDNAAVRIIMGGAGNVDDLEDISRLMGEAKERQTVRTLGTTGSGLSISKGKRRVLSAEEIRTLPFGTAVVVARAARPVEIVLTPWWKRPDGDEIALGKSWTEKLVVQYSEAAEQDLAGRRRPGASASPPPIAGLPVVSPLIPSVPPTTPPPTPPPTAFAPPVAPGSRLVVPPGPNSSTRSH